MTTTNLFRFLVTGLTLAVATALWAADDNLQPWPKKMGASRLVSYRDELQRFRSEFGGAKHLPGEPFFLFGMGLRPKLLYRSGALMLARSGALIRRWDVAEEVIVPPAYAIQLPTRTGDVVRIMEDEQGVWIEEAGKHEVLPGTTKRVHLPDFDKYAYPQVMRVLHQELLFNVTTNGPVPNLFVYDKPWYRDGAMMAMALKRTGNVDCLRDWVLSLHEPYDRNNAGETEANNLGQALFLISLVSDKAHPLVSRVLAEVPKLERREDGAKFIAGRSDFSEHPAYQTKWLKLGLRELGLPDNYTVPRMPDSYSALFWIGYKETYQPGKDADDRQDYPYLGWACDHFHSAKKSPISDRDYPLTWEIRASQANYAGMKVIDPVFVEQKTAAPHTWHAAEIFLYLLDPVVTNVSKHSDLNKP